MTETPGSYFEDLWETSTDPWEHATRWYEERKYDLTVAALPRRRYRYAVEPACGVGLLTARLARRAERVSASDRFARAVHETATRCAGDGHVVVECRDVREGPAEDQFDLAVLAEVLYYFDASTVVEILDTWRVAAAADAQLVLVHYRPSVSDHVLNGDDVHEIAHRQLGQPTITIDDPEFRLDLFDAR